MKIRAIVNLRAGLAAHRALDAMAASRPTWPATVRTRARWPSRVRNAASRSNSGRSASFVTITTSTGPPSRVGASVLAAGGSQTDPESA